MAKRKSQRVNIRTFGMIGALAAACAGGGYFAGKNGFPFPVLPANIAALLPGDKPTAIRAAKPAEAKQADATPAQLKEKSDLTRFVKNAESKIIAAVRVDGAKLARARDAYAKDAPVRKTLAKADSAKRPSAKAAAAKAEPQQNDASAPLPPASIPNRPAVDSARTASITASQAEPPADAASVQSGAAPLAISLLGKGIPTSESDTIRLSVGFANLTGKPIRAFEGVLKFTDGNDVRLFSSKISVSALIAQGGSLQWDERVNPVKLDRNGKRLVSEDKENLKAVFQANKVFFVDGSVQQFGAKG